jgi:hypothetical protein
VIPEIRHRYAQRWVLDSFSWFLESGRKAAFFVHTKAMTITAQRDALTNTCEAA